MRCDHCGQDFRGTYGDQCPGCGHSTKNPFTDNPDNKPESSGPSPWESPQAHTGGPSAEGALGGIPWETEKSMPSMFETIKVVLIDSTDTFGRADSQMSIGPAFIFAAILGIAGGAIGLVWQFLMGAGLANVMGEMGVGDFASAMAPNAVGAIMLPFQIVIALFITTAVIHLCLMMVGGANEGFETTFRVVAFAQGSVAVFQVLPFLGPLVGAIWALVIYVVGIREMHNTTVGKAAAAVLIPIAACCICIGIGALAIGGVAGFMGSNY